MLKVALQFSAVDDMQDLEYEQRLRTPSSVSSVTSVSSVCKLGDYMNDNAV